MQADVHSHCCYSSHRQHSKTSNNPGTQAPRHPGTHPPESARVRTSAFSSKDLFGRPVGVIVAAGIVQVSVPIVQLVVHLPIVHVFVVMISVVVVVLAVLAVSRAFILILLLKHVSLVSSAAWCTRSRVLARRSQHCLQAPSTAAAHGAPGETSLVPVRPGPSRSRCWLLDRHYGPVTCTHSASFDQHNRRRCNRAHARPQPTAQQRAARRIAPHTRRHSCPRAYSARRPETGCSTAPDTHARPIGTHCLQMCSALPSLPRGGCTQEEHLWAGAVLRRSADDRPHSVEARARQSQTTGHPGPQQRCSGAVAGACTGRGTANAALRAAPAAPGQDATGPRRLRSRPAFLPVAVPPPTATALLPPVGTGTHSGVKRGEFSFTEQLLYLYELNSTFFSFFYDLIGQGGQ